MLVDIYSKDGQKTGEIELQEKIFAVEPNEHAMHLAVVSYLANQRQGTAKTKNFVNILKNLQINNDKTLVLLPKYDLNLYMSARNIPKLSIYPIDKISTYDILNHKKLLFFKGAIESLENIILK